MTVFPAGKLFCGPFSALVSLGYSYGISLFIKRAAGSPGSDLVGGPWFSNLWSRWCGQTIRYRLFPAALQRCCRAGTRHTVSPTALYIQCTRSSHPQPHPQRADCSSLEMTVQGGLRSNCMYSVVMALLTAAWPNPQRCFPDVHFPCGDISESRLPPSAAS